MTEDGTTMTETATTDAETTTIGAGIMKEEGTADGTQNGRGTTTTDATTKEDIDTIGD